MGRHDLAQPIDTLSTLTSSEPSSSLTHPSKITLQLISRTKNTSHVSLAARPAPYKHSENPSSPPLSRCVSTFPPTLLELVFLCLSLRLFVTYRSNGTAKIWNQRCGSPIVRSERSIDISGEPFDFRKHSNDR